VSVWLCQIAKNLFYKEYASRKRKIENSTNDISRDLQSREAHTIL